MSPGGSGSQEPFSSRNPSNLPRTSESQSNIGLSSPLVQSAETPNFSQSVIPGPESHWPLQHIQGSICTVQGGSQPTGFALPLPSHHSTLNPGTSQPHTLPGLNYPTESTAQSSIEDTIPIKEEIESEVPRGLGISSYPMSVVSDTYFAGPMQHNNQQYAWTNRPYQPLQPGQMNPPFPSSHPSYPASSYTMGYPSHSNVPLHGYQQQEHQLPASYLTALGNPSRHSQPRSPPVARPFHPQSVSGTSQPEQPLMTSPPPYMINQPAYYFPDTQPIPSHPTPISSQPPSMTAPEPIYSSPESAAAKDSDPVRVLNLRPRPQCWDHGCNGREFSTFSNLLRHQREKSGVVAKAECPVCGAVFTRTTARNIHVAQGKCKSPGRESSAE
ncbi:unnamed protein product [Penicillium nalgiovense]|uniref:C2H2-type domain-containing protein n=1 Tax=Penicillium nalgiovense TaxID=60175 RepID=A0A9W4HQ88_PENNA|nr:unnamed protein product [Penicillium nalgiovense]CAG7990197.1 unnamed protein product [Penicillium nalgiovense]CAG7996472.1 unnamed protein product [Penicillium nalgiovense]CAG8010028.1 unnamed protein product [Penicillium nalgiovense]CAG8011095.1 unnamed protein product [Penicillium nalgiovense]